MQGTTKLVIRITLDTFQFYKKKLYKASDSPANNEFISKFQVEEYLGNKLDRDAGQRKKETK